MLSLFVMMWSFTDYLMPGLYKKETATELRIPELGKQLPVIVPPPKKDK